MQTPPDLRELERKLDEVAGRRSGLSKNRSSRKRAAFRDQEKSLARGEVCQRGRGEGRGRRPVRRGRRGSRRRGAVVVDRDSRVQAHRGRDRRACSTWKASCTSGSSARRTRSAASPRRSAAPAPASRTRTVRSVRSSSSGPPASARPSSAKALAEFLFGDEDGAHPHRHVGVHGEAHRRRAWSARLPATSATRRAASSPRRCGASRTRWCCSTRSRRRTPTSSTCCCRSWRRAA